MYTQKWNNLCHKWTADGNLTHEFIIVYPERTTTIFTCCFINPNKSKEKSLL